MHICDNRGCVNIAHLRLGTNSDNIKDCFAKGRRAMGAKHHNARLSDEQVRNLWVAWAAGEKLRVLAERFKISEASVFYIARGRVRREA